MEQILKTMLENVRAKSPPLVHNITNYVTVNDVANVLLAAGGSPIMSGRCRRRRGHHKHLRRAEHQHRHAQQKTPSRRCSSPGRRQTPRHIVLLDPVGAGASRLRTDTANRLMQEVRFDAVRGNISEIKTLHRQRQRPRVDADAVDAVTEANLDDGVQLVKAFAQKTGCIVAVTGAIDLVRRRALLVHPQRSPEMSRITGTGCQLGTDDGVSVANLCTRGRDRLGRKPHFQHDRRAPAAAKLVAARSAPARKRTAGRFRPYGWRRTPTACNEWRPESA